MKALRPKKSSTKPGTFTRAYIKELLKYAPPLPPPTKADLMKASRIARLVREGKPI